MSADTLFVRLQTLSIALVIALAATTASAKPAKKKAKPAPAVMAPASGVVANPEVPAAARGRREITMPTLPSGRPDLWDSYMTAQKDHAERNERAIASEYGFKSVGEMATWEAQAQREARVAPRRGGDLIALIVDSKKARITSDYGMRVDPLSDGLGTHAGVDIAAPYGTPILAISSGTVTYAAYNGGNGFMVELAHADGTRTRYCHASSMLVSKGREVLAGDRVALMGSTGRSTGSHVHFEVRRNGIPMNPHAYVRTLLRNADTVAAR